MTYVKGHNDTGLIDALNHLSSVCDGANELDGQGFNGRDTDIGKSLAKWGREKGFLTVNQRHIAKKLVWRYRKQLERAGHDVVSIVDKQGKNSHAG